MPSGMSEQEREDVLAASEFITIQMDLYNRVLGRCWDKCIAHYWDKDLTVGEGSCVDRCVVKYMTVQRTVAKRVLGIRAWTKREEERQKVIQKLRDNQMFGV
ncbi:Tim10/DDP family zinc finger superfamily protein [Acanthamoeba castellanii str. Neff]|uniref:Mitochondrial import inner membrane translocase subunit n=1 Tax=Acanthamoeba castellanii (strain ATCC 30010 / Neff) TaxID=1257118 RepID=L8GPU1_ACACF|nr:Tim10/DDP family zinc finger superfamily protein [Acanthamoeba castellanii str. Neff]ELR14121.1 Tim10/DDP family zinc finger superfamily protein [Acanthamoeba castellanii str. Neff]